MTRHLEFWTSVLWTKCYCRVINRVKHFQKMESQKNRFIQPKLIFILVILNASIISCSLNRIIHPLTIKMTSFSFKRHFDQACLVFIARPCIWWIGYENHPYFCNYKNQLFRYQVCCYWSTVFFWLGECPSLKNTSGELREVARTYLAKIYRRLVTKTNIPNLLFIFIFFSMLSV